VPKLAASAAAPGALQAGHYWGVIDGRDDLVDALRAIFELPALAPESDVTAQLDRFEQLVATPADGVDTDHLLRALREALRLPALSTATEVIAEVRKGLATAPEPTTATMSRTPAREMTMKTFLMLATLLGLSAKTEDDASDALLSTAKDGLELRTALGAKDHVEATAKLGKLTTEAAKVPALEAEIATFRKEREDRETADRETYVGDVVLGMALPEDQRARVTASLKLHAKTDWTGFQKEYPRPSATTLAQRAQDGERTKRTGAASTRTKAPAADVGAAGEPTANDLVEAAMALVEEHANRGQRLSFSEAIGMLTDRDLGAPASAPAPSDDDQDDTK
jgi:hypothetical protein